MSKAFTKEDADEPQRSGRKSKTPGLPPGAVNFMTAEGAKRLRQKEQTDELRQILDSATIVSPRQLPPEEVLFGSTVTLKTAKGEFLTYRVVGVNECDLEPGWISWISALAKALIGLKLGSRVQLPDTSMEEKVEIVRIEN